MKVDLTTLYNLSKKPVDVGGFVSRKARVPTGLDKDRVPVALVVIFRTGLLIQILVKGN